MEYSRKIIEMVQSGQAGEALRLCEQYCREQPKLADAWFLRASVQAQLGGLEEVVACCRKVVELAPGHVGAWYNLGVALQGLRLWEDAVRAYERAIQLNPSYISPYTNISIVLRQLGRFADAVSFAREVVRLGPGQAACINNLGLMLLDSGEIDEALEQFEKAIQLDPDAPGTLLNKGLALDRKGDHEAAVKWLRAVVQRDPGNIDAWIEIGNIQRRQNDFDAAIGTYQAVVEKYPDQPVARNLIGLALIEAGRPQEAIQWIEKALEIRPHYADAYNALGGARHALGDTANAVSAFERAVALDPQCALAQNNLGLLSKQGGDPVQAEQRFRAALQADPGNGDIENNLGTVLMEQGRFDEAIDIFRSATRHDARHAAAWNNLGNALLCVEQLSENFPEAEAAYRRAIELKPDLAEAYYHFATCLQQQGYIEQAFQRFSEALVLRPDYTDASAGQVMMLERLGRFQEAEDILRPLLEGHRDNMQVALAFGDMARHLDQREQALAMLETLDPQGLQKWARIQRNFVIGDLYDDAGQHSKAFAHYHAANAEDHPGYSVTLTRHQYALMKAAYSSDRQASRPRASNRSGLPVFIVGMPRSGTTLLEQILASHPDVYGAGELEDMQRLSLMMQKHLNSKLPYPACMADATTATLDRIAGEYLEHLQAYAPDARRIVDKMPHNYQALGLIDSLFPGARVLHCKRNPIDTCVSIYFKHFNSFHPYASDLKSLGLFYRQYEQLMDYWKRTLAVPIFDVQYEEVVANQEEMSRRILEFVGLEWDERCLNYHQHERTVITPSYDQVRKPIYTGSVGRWRRYEKHLGPLLEALGD